MNNSLNRLNLVPEEQNALAVERFVLLESVAKRWAALKLGILADPEQEFYKKVERVQRLSLCKSIDQMAAEMTIQIHNPNIRAYNSKCWDTDKVLDLLEV